MSEHTITELLSPAFLSRIRTDRPVPGHSDSVDLQWIFLSGRCPSIFLSTLSGRTFLSAGTKCHDTGILSSSHSR